MKKNSIKNIRINEEVLRELSDIIRNKVKDPRIDPMTSVTSVEVAPDLKTCKIFVSVLGDGDAGKKTIEGLKSSRGFIRHELARTVNLRNTPELTFLLDGVRMSKLIDDVKEHDRKMDEKYGTKDDKKDEE